MNQTHSEKVRKWDFLGLFLVNRFLCVYIYSYIYTYILDSVGKCTCIDSIHVHISGEKHLYRLGLSIAMFDYQRVP
jgi:hypothetical protein